MLVRRFSSSSGTCSYFAIGASVKKRGFKVTVGTCNSFVEFVNLGGKKGKKKLSLSLSWFRPAKKASLTAS